MSKMNLTISEKGGPLVYDHCSCKQRSDGTSAGTEWSSVRLQLLFLVKLLGHSSLPVSAPAASLIRPFILSVLPLPLPNVPVAAT